MPPVDVLEKTLNGRATARRVTTRKNFRACSAGVSTLSVHGRGRRGTARKISLLQFGEHMSAQPTENSGDRQEDA